MFRGQRVLNTEQRTEDFNLPDCISLVVNVMFVSKIHITKPDSIWTWIQSS